MLVYVAGPIDFSDGDSTVKTVRAGILEVAADKGWCTFDPSAAFSVCGPPTAAVQNINQYAIDSANAVIAFLVDGVVSFGTPMEIQYAIDCGKPVALVTNIESSWALARVDSFSLDDIASAFDFLENYLE